MPIRITLTLTEPFKDLSIHDHVNGDRQLFPDRKAAEEAGAGTEGTEATGGEGSAARPDIKEPSEEMPELGPFWVETIGSSPRLGRLLFRYVSRDRPAERLFDVREGWNPIPPHDNFDAFAKFVVERGLEKK